MVEHSPSQAVSRTEHSIEHAIEHSTTNDKSSNAHVMDQVNQLRKENPKNLKTDLGQVNEQLAQACFLPRLAISHGGTAELYESTPQINGSSKTKILATAAEAKKPSQGLQGADSSQKIYNFFTHKGLTPQAAAGIVGNFQQESSCNPNEHQQGGGPGYGLAQWEASNPVDGGGRLNNLEKFAHQTHQPVSGLATQLQFAYKEMQQSYPGLKQQLNSAGSASAAASIFCTEYEGAGTPDLGNRQSAAQTALATHGKQA